MNDGFTINIKLKLRYLVIVVLATVAFVIALTVFYAKADKDLRDIISFGSTLMGATAGLLVVFYTAQSIRESNRDKLNAAASRFVERWNDPQYYDLKKKWRDLNEELESKTPDERFNCLNTDPQKRITAVEIFNFYEEMAIAINMEVADEDVLKRFFRTIAVRYYEHYEYWIAQHRKVRNAPRFCLELEAVVRRWRAN